MPKDDPGGLGRSGHNGAVSQRERAVRCAQHAAHAGVGLAYFYTQTALNTDDESYQIAQTTNYSDNSLLYTGGAGFNIPLSFAGDYVSMDVGARYNSVNSARYLTKGDIMDDPNSQYGIIITPRQSAANFIACHLGVSFRF